MNAVQIHLALNHAPLFLSLAGGLLLAAGMIRKNEVYKLLALYTLIAGALLTIPVFLSGEATEETAERLPGIAGAMIESHEDMAKISLYVIGITGVIALLVLLLRKNKAVQKTGLYVVLLCAVLSFGSMARTAHLGGQIRHTELQPGTTTIPNTSSSDEKDKGDDD